ncbi:glutaredoxin family protein [Mycolicibacterium mageritense]|uniref:glutaredoxin family protein n=1 Tax=Mycolicibacterium mageritense TaxID=53462 RepID=UPI0011D55807|nr:glutaredoxin family protein [Mycolicibacterium mageritense]TXI62482.1 MAG: glutaredoxin family protein [Mycolicibacterium mageritense]
MIATLFSQPGCDESLFAAADLTECGIEFLVRDVRFSADAAVDCVDWYRTERPDAVPSTPVVVIDHHAYFGAVELHRHLRDMAVAA